MRYFIGFLVTLGLIILLIILLFRGSGKPKVAQTSKTLDSYASTSAEVSLTTDGPVNAESDHQQTRITVSSDQVTYEQIKGYTGNVVKTQHYNNNQTSYDVFLHALEHAGFTLGDTSKALSDERGYCSTGSRYIMELKQDGKTLERFWTSSCAKPKTYLGSLSLTLTLFQTQVPDFDQLNEDFQP